MKTYLLNLWDTMRTSYWFVPSLCAIAAVCLALLLPMLDRMIADRGWELPGSVLTTTDAARSTLSVIAGTMVTVTGTVFSITIVTLSLTSQQFGPRLLRRFVHDLPTQFTLGIFLSTGLYCLLVIRIVEKHEEGMVAPHLSVVAAVLMTVLSMGMLILFIHHVAMLIQAPQIVAAVAGDLDSAIDRLFPEAIGKPSEDAPTERSPDPPEPEPAGRLQLRSTREGYIEGIDGEGLMTLACQGDVVLRLEARPGYFIANGTLLAEVWPGAASSLEELSGDELTQRLNEAVIVGIRRTPRQDVECSIEELVEVAVRSLSPGINDPFTAINCIDRLGASLARLAQRRLPPSRRYDKEGHLRVIANNSTFTGALNAAFNQIRQYGHGSVAVVSRLLEALGFVAEFVHRPEDREAVRMHAEMVARLGQEFSEEHDRQAVEERHRRVQQALEGRPVNLD